MENILSNKILSDIPSRPTRPITLNDVVGMVFDNGIELTMVFKDNHAESVNITSKYIGNITRWDRLQDMINELFSGDTFLLNQSLKSDHPNLWEDLTKYLGQNGIEISNAYYMEL